MLNHHDSSDLKIVVVRRLAAVLSADAVGYSRLMGQDELGTVRTIIGHRQVIEGLVRSVRGVVVDSPGDNVLAQFASAVDAVACAVDIQRALAARNAALAAERRLQFRIGVNTGRILVEGTRIYGDTVNIAARIQPLAPPGGVCVSEAVYQQIGGVLPIDWEQLGEQRFKNIDRPIRVLRALLEAPVVPAGVVTQLAVNGADLRAECS